MASVHHGLGRLGWSIEEARRIAQKHALMIRPPGPPPPTSINIRTHALDGEEQRHRTGALSSNERFILGMAYRSAPAMLIATAFMVSDQAVYARLDRYGLNVKSRRRRWQIVDAQAAQQERLVVEIYDDEPQIERPPAQG